MRRRDISPHICIFGIPPACLSVTCCGCDNPCPQYNGVRTEKFITVAGGMPQLIRANTGIRQDTKIWRRNRVRPGTHADPLGLQKTVVDKRAGFDRRNPGA
jgi:hypothetical protein